MRTSRRRRIGAAAIIGGVGMGLAGLVTAGPAGADPPGNNGTIKVDDVEFDAHPHNEPHVSCAFEVDFYGYDLLEGTHLADVTFAVHPPTGNEVILTDEVFAGEDDNGGGGSEEGLDAHQEYDLSALLAGFDVHQQGYHVKLTVNAPGSQGADVKHKVFWVGPCEEPPPPEPGRVVIAKDVTGGNAPGEDTAFAFELDCDGEEFDEEFDLTDDTSIAFDGIPDGSECTLSETEDHGGNASFVVDGVPAGSGPVQFTIDEETDVEVDVTNDFPISVCEVNCSPTPPPPPPPPAAVPSGDAVDCAGPGGTPGILVTLVNTGEADATFTVLRDFVPLVLDADSATVTPAEGQELIVLPQAEDEQVTISISSGAFEAEFQLAGDCAPAGVLPAQTSQSSSAQVLGVQQTRPAAALPRTGFDPGVLLVLGGGLVLVGVLTLRYGEG